jgi:hypothetical protein
VHAFVHEQGLFLGRAHDAVAPFAFALRRHENVTRDAYPHDVALREGVAYSFL